MLRRLCIYMYNGVLLLLHLGSGALWSCIGRVEKSPLIISWEFNPFMTVSKGISTLYSSSVWAVLCTYLSGICSPMLVTLGNGELYTEDKHIFWVNSCRPLLKTAATNGSTIYDIGSGYLSHVQPCRSHVEQCSPRTLYHSSQIVTMIAASLVVGDLYFTVN